MTTPATLPGTEQHLLRSAAVGADFEITVKPPDPALEAGPTPVVYGTDARRLPWRTA